MPFCSRRTWKTPSGFTTWPTPGCYDDGVVLPRFQSHTHTGKTTGVYHDNHPDTAPDAGLRVPLLTRHHPGCCPTFIPAFTPVIQLAAAPFTNETKELLRQLPRTNQFGAPLIQLF